MAREPGTSYSGQEVYRRVAVGREFIDELNLSGNILTSYSGQEVCRRATGAGSL